MRGGPLPPKTPAGIRAEAQRVTAARPLLPAPRVPGESVHCRGARLGPSGDTHRPRQSSESGAVGSPRERSVRPRHQWGGRCRGASRGPVPAVSLRCQAHGFSGSPGLPTKAPPSWGEVLCVWRASRPHPTPQFPHLERHMPVTSSGLSEPEGAHKKGNRSSWLDCVSQRTGELPEAACSGRRQATPVVEPRRCPGWE